MTLQQAIETYEGLSEDAKEVMPDMALEYWKTAQWLRELKEFRETDPNFPKLNLDTLKMEG